MTTLGGTSPKPFSVVFLRRMSLVVIVLKETEGPQMRRHDLPKTSTRALCKANWSVYNTQGTYVNSLPTVGV